MTLFFLWESLAQPLIEWNGDIILGNVSVDGAMLVLVLCVMLGKNK